MTEAATGRLITVHPILDDVTKMVHGVWLRIAPIDQTSTPPAAWAFSWDLNRGLARRSSIVGGDGETWEDLGIDKARSLASGLAHLSMGQSIDETLALLVESIDGSTIQKQAIENRPSGSSRNIQIFGQFFTDKTHSESDLPQRFVRGVSVDLGDACEVTASAVPKLGDQVIQALRPQGQNVAVVDPRTCEILYWHGPAPDYVEWRPPPVQGGRPVIHVDDKASAREAFADAAAAPCGGVTEVVLRFLSPSSDYVPVTLTVTTIDLGCSPAPVLAVFKELSSSAFQ